MVFINFFSFTGIAQERRYAQTLQNLQELQTSKEQHRTTPQKLLKLFNLDKIKSN